MGTAQSADEAFDPNEPHWLPQDHHLALTAYEAGWLTGLLLWIKDGNRDVGVNVPDAAGKPIQSTMARVLADRVIASQP